MKSSSGTPGHVDFYSGLVAAIKGSAFVDSRDSDRSQRFFIRHSAD
jgi:hypothetical protein